jgi:hypothetical protein
MHSPQVAEIADDIPRKWTSPKWRPSRSPTPVSVLPRDSAQSQKVGLQCYPLSDYTIAAPRPNALVLGCASVPAERMRPYLGRLAEALSRP